ncbi:AcrR family transcriptional regulator [Rhizomicrobium palustre]|uniref:AcrR family transcriptional regulator n=1 Tax=Rhizomicrobium palustre TaxID=189966 RepID=A0A846MXJ0_9PROT|nr:TetR/AcrR family transcriptional regulator [Rhizomicrobium palustre]NIK88294.1 AcrR family transcriptional regulator [Rhizomicrobium palustre]
MDNIPSPDTAVDTKPEADRHSRTWQRRKQARPGEILDAALTVFAEKGFSAARMEDIAARAGVTKGTIYLYFQSKEEVFKQLARQHVGDKLNLATTAARDFEGSTFDFLMLFFHGFACNVVNSEAAALPKIIIAESGNFPELAIFWRKEVIDRSMSFLRGIIEKGIARGEIRDLPVDYICKLCAAPMLMSLIWRTTFAQTDDKPFDYDAFLAVHRDVLYRGLRAGGAA